MSGPTVRIKVDFGGRRRPRHRAVESSLQASRNGTTTLPSRAARMLALAHHIESLVERGVLRDYADAARRLGLTRARVTQVTNLTLLSPDIQEAVLTGELRVSERELRRVVAAGEWTRQGDVVPRPPNRDG